MVSSGDMVKKKKGGTKRKIPMKKIESKPSLAVAHSKRRRGLYSKASQLCLLDDGSQLAILVAPLSSDSSNVSFYSFGHSSTDSVLSAFLSGHPPAPLSMEARKSLGLGFWWEGYVLSEDPDDLMDAINSTKEMIASVEELLAQKVIMGDDDTTHHQTLIPQAQTEMVVLDDLPAFNHNNNNSDEEEVDFETYLEQLLTNDKQNHHHEDQTLTSDCANTQIVFLDDDDDLPPAAFNNNNNDQEVDFENYLETLLMNENENHHESHEPPTIDSSHCADTQIVVFNNNNEEEEMDYDNLIDFDTSVETMISDGVFQSHQEFDHFTQHLLMDDNDNDNDGTHNNNETINPPHHQSSVLDDDLPSASFKDTCAEVSMMETTNPLLFSDLDFLVQDGPAFLTAFDDFDDDTFSHVFTNIAPF